MMWGKRKENGIWLASTSRKRLMFRGHDSFYAAIGKVRIRIMKPGY